MITSKDTGTNAEPRCVVIDGCANHDWRVVGCCSGLGSTSRSGQTLQQHVHRLRQPPGDAGYHQVDISEESEAAEEGHPEQALLGSRPGAVVMQLRLEPLHQLGGPTRTRWTKQPSRAGSAGRRP